MTRQQLQTDLQILQTQKIQNYGKSYILEKVNTVKLFQIFVTKVVFLFVFLFEQVLKQYKEINLVNTNIRPVCLNTQVLLGKICNNVVLHIEQNDELTTNSNVILSRTTRDLANSVYSNQSQVINTQQNLTYTAYSETKINISDCEAI